MRRKKLITATSPVSCTADSYTKAKEEGKEFPFHIHHPCQTSAGCTTGSGAEERPLHGHFIANRRRFSVCHAQKTMVRRFSALTGSQRKTTGTKKKGFRPRMCNMKSRMHKLLFLFFSFTQKHFPGAVKHKDQLTALEIEMNQILQKWGAARPWQETWRSIDSCLATSARTSVFSREEAVRSPFSIVEATKHCASEREIESENAGSGLIDSDWCWTHQANLNDPNSRSKLHFPNRKFTWSVCLCVTQLLWGHRRRNSLF